MDIAAILREIDAELERLETIRSILSGLSAPAAPHSTSRQPRVRQKPAPSIPEQQPEPRLIVLPPKIKREGRVRVRPEVVEPKALAAPLSNQPVFVPKAQAPQPSPLPKPQSDEDLEAALRRNLLGSAA